VFGLACLLGAPAAGCGGGTGPAASGDIETPEHVEIAPEVPEVEALDSAHEVDGMDACACPCGCMETGACVPCTGCSGKVCGGDGLGGSCGQCPDGEHCDGGQCVEGECPAGFVLAPPGTFMMGAADSDPYGGLYLDIPQHEVTITRAFCIRAWETTRGEWSELMGTDPSWQTGCQDDSCPIDNLSWFDAVAYCNALSRRDGLPPCYQLEGCTGVPGLNTYDEYGKVLTKFSCAPVLTFDIGCAGYRLPTEAEWEYAARAGTTTSTYNGDVTSPYAWSCTKNDPVVEPIAWYCSNSVDGPHPVMTKQANPWGLYDTAGNVIEWVWDQIAEYTTEPAVDPTGLDPVEYHGNSRVVRGGGWLSHSMSVRVTSRGRFSFSDLPFYAIGFRVVIGVR
jgi:formylglycine-generating enzyme required for sulfatase activity